MEFVYMLKHAAKFLFMEDAKNVYQNIFFRKHVKLVQQGVQIVIRNIIALNVQMVII